MKSVKNYVYTERAHFMCPNMHFGIMVRIKSSYDKEQVKESLKILQEAHPFLTSLIAEEKETHRLYYQVQDCINIPVTEKTDATLWQRDYNDISSNGWNVKKEYMLKVLAYPQADEFQILFISHHLLCDGRGLLQLAEEFSEYYAHKTVPPFTQEHLIRSIHDLPANADLPLISKLMIKEVNRRWDKEQHPVSYEAYLDFEKDFSRSNIIQREVDTLKGQAFEDIRTLCKQHGISINDYLLARMMRENNINKVIIAADIRDQIHCYNPGAMGNYSTAFSVVITKKEKDMFSLAKQISAKVLHIMKQPQKQFLVLACYLHMRPELIDAVAISALGTFGSKAGAFVGRNMFGYGSRNGYSITNLGKIQSDIIAEATFIPPASPANKKTWGVLTVNDHMNICESTLMPRN